jgi:replicative DNA helicase
MADQFYEAEQQIMASIVQGYETDLLPTDLRDGPHQMIVEASIALRDDGIVPDAITIKHWIGKHRGEENFGDFDYLNTLRDMYANPKRQEVYESIVKDRALRQKIISHANALLHEEGDGCTTDDLIVMAQTSSVDLSAGRAASSEALAQDVAYDVLEEIQARRGKDNITGVETPWKELNKLTSGLQGGDLIIVAGRPSMGKTALAAQIAKFAAYDGPVYIGSLEMDSSSLVERMLVGDARVEADRVRGGYLNQDEYEKLQIACDRIQDQHPIIINDSPRLSAQELRMSISQANLRYKGLQIAVVDYLGLLRDDGRGQQRYKEVGDAVKVLRSTAKDLNIPVVLVCQLNRSCEARENKRPILSDLRESGDIEQDSDVIFFVYRDDYYCHDCPSTEVECDKGHAGKAEVICRKQRQGPTGTVNLTWEARYTSFSNQSIGDYDDYSPAATGPVASDFALPGELEEEEPSPQREIDF